MSDKKLAKVVINVIFKEHHYYKCCAFTYICIKQKLILILWGCQWFRRDRGVYKEHVASEYLALKKTQYINNRRT